MPVVPDGRMSGVTDVARPASRARRLSLGEDWLAVWVAAAVIALALSGVRPTAPRFIWATPADLATVFGRENLGRVLQLAVLLLVPSAAGAVLMGARTGAFVAGFSALFGLAVLAQLAAAHAAMAAWGL